MTDDPVGAARRAAVVGIAAPAADEDPLQQRRTAGVAGREPPIALEALLDDDVLVAWAADGEPLSHAHGGPVRLLVPRRYFWKSAKYLQAIELLEQLRTAQAIALLQEIERDALIMQIRQAAHRARERLTPMPPENYRI